MSKVTRIDSPEQLEVAVEHYARRQGTWYFWSAPVLALAGFVVSVWTGPGWFQLGAGALVAYVAFIVGERRETLRWLRMLSTMMPEREDER